MRSFVRPRHFHVYEKVSFHVGTAKRTYCASRISCQAYYFEYLGSRGRALWAFSNQYSVGIALAHDMLARHHARVRSLAFGLTRQSGAPPRPSCLTSYFRMYDLTYAGWLAA